MGRPNTLFAFALAHARTCSQMKSEPLGKSTSEVEVTNISRHGLWLIVDDEELFLPFDEFPWFKDASVQAILNVQRHAEHFHWPTLDVDST